MMRDRLKKWYWKNLTIKGKILISSIGITFGLDVILFICLCLMGTFPWINNAMHTIGLLTFGMFCVMMILSKLWDKYDCCKLI